jgi:hypothetical protein
MFKSGELYTKSWSFLDNELKDLLYFDSQTDLQEKKKAISEIKEKLLEPLETASAFLQSRCNEAKVDNPLSYGVQLVRPVVENAERLIPLYLKSQKQALCISRFDRLEALLEKLVEKSEKDWNSLSATEKELLKIFDVAEKEEPEQEKSIYAELFDNVSQDFNDMIPILSTPLMKEVKDILSSVSNLYNEEKVTRVLDPVLEVAKNMSTEEVKDELVRLVQGITRTFQN